MDLGCFVRGSVVWLWFTALRLLTLCVSIMLSLIVRACTKVFQIQE